MRDDKTSQHHRGIVARVDPAKAPRGGDVAFGPDYTVTSTNDNGGLVLTNVEVILCFWGRFWTNTPSPSPSAADYKQAFEGIVSGPYMQGLLEYRGVAQGSIIYTDLNDSSDPGNPYTDADIVAMLTTRLDTTSMPPPTAGHNRFYAVIAPKGVANSLSKFAGQHQSFTYKGVKGYYAWVDNTGSLAGHDSTTKVFSHELVEACTNPDVDTLNNSILVNGTKADGTAITNDEIGDTCNEQFATVDMNGVQCTVQSYWSKVDNACILPLWTLAFWVDKSTFGKDEVQDALLTSGGRWNKAFWVVLEGFSKISFTSLAVTVPTPTGSFASLAGVTVVQNPLIEFENGKADGDTQRIRIPFDIVFGNAAVGGFPASGSQIYELRAFIATHGSRASADVAAPFELVAGADPYFTNIDPAQGNVWYLSQDLRVFTATPGLDPNPVVGAPAFTDDSPSGAYTFIQSLLAWLNVSFADPSGADPFNTVLPSQGGALAGDSSVSAVTLRFPRFLNNYNFAVARVRLRGTAGPAGQASNARVLFRLWTTQTCDTDFQPASTYPSTLDPAGQPGSPLVGVGHVTLPFFASGNGGGATDYGPGGPNIRTLVIPAGKDQVWAYFGCFLNLFDPANVIDGQQVNAWLAGTHHCLVAQLAFDGAPVVAGASPETSDKLAQRNLQVTLSDNPGPAATHRVPQTFDLRPSPVAAQPTEVDELMIDWGAIPPGSVASIYWPQVPAASLLDLATKLYGSHKFTLADAHTVRCAVIGGVSYLPIPPGAGDSLAGLFTIDLPQTVRTGQEFVILVRRIGRRETRDVVIAARARGRGTRAWRYVIGTFQVKIPVSTPSVMLRPEEDTLAIMKWRLQQMVPGNRWRPVLERYIDITDDRVAGLGGKPEAIPPSPTGAPLPHHLPAEEEHCGRVTAIEFDCFGDLKGFVLETCCERRRFQAHGRGLASLLLQACREDLRLCVVVCHREPERISRVVVRG